MYGSSGLHWTSLKNESTVTLLFISTPFSLAEQEGAVKESDRQATTLLIIKMITLEEWTNNMSY